MQKRPRPDTAASSASYHSIWQGPHELWTAAASVLARVLRNGSLKSILAPMRSEQARPINALVTETLKRRDLLERLVDQCGPWHAASGHELRLLLAHEALFGRGLHQSALQRATEDATLAEALERLRGWEATTLKAAKAAARESGAVSAGAAAAEPEPSEVVCKLPRYARVNTLKATQDAVVAALCAEGWVLVDAPISLTGGATHRGKVSSCGSWMPQAAACCSHQCRPLSGRRQRGEPASRRPRPCPRTSGSIRMCRAFSSCRRALGC